MINYVPFDHVLNTHSIAVQGNVKHTISINMMAVFTPVKWASGLGVITVSFSRLKSTICDENVVINTSTDSCGFGGQNKLSTMWISTKWGYMPHYLFLSCPVMIDDTCCKPNGKIRILFLGP